jgi:hypothetical protein
MKKLNPSISIAAIIHLALVAAPATSEEVQTPARAPDIESKEKIESASPKSAPVPEPPHILNRKIDKALEALRSEPTLQSLQIAALDQADLVRSETARWKNGVRLQALLPDLKLAADYDMGRDESLDRYQEKPDRWGADTDSGYGFGLSAQWHLSELVFNADELKVYDRLSDLASRREALLSLLAGYYFERRRLQLTLMLSPPTDLQALLALRIRIRELTAAIDALTGGRLTDRISQRNSAP